LPSAVFSLATNQPIGATTIGITTLSLIVKRTARGESTVVENSTCNPEKGFNPHSGTRRKEIRKNVKRSMALPTNIRLAEKASLGKKHSSLL